MHFGLILVLVAVASSTPLGWSTTGRLPSVVSNPDNLWQRVIRPSPAQQSALNIGEEIEQVRNVVQREGLGVEGVHNHKSDVAQQAAREVVQQALLARQRQTIEGIEDLQQQQNIIPQSIVGQISGNQAIEQLHKQLLFQRSVAPMITVTSQLAKTLEAAIESQLTLENVGVRIGESSLNSGVFQAKVQQLVDQSNIQEIQTEISRQQAKIQQLQEQTLLVKQQKQQIQVKLSIVLQGQESTMQLEEVRQQLQEQEDELVSQQLARQLVIQQLQQALIEQQQQLQQDILSELRSQKWVERGSRLGQVSGIDMISTAEQRVPYQTRQYGLLRTDIRRPWYIYGNSWSRNGIHVPRTTWLA